MEAKEASQTRTEERGAASLEFRDALHRLSDVVERMARQVRGRPLYQFGPEFPSLTTALAAIAEPTPLLGLIVGGPKVGKTNLLINLALGLLENTQTCVVAFVSAEVPAKQLRARFLCAHAARRRQRAPSAPLPTKLVDLNPCGREIRAMTKETLTASALNLERSRGRLFVIDREGLPGGRIEPRAVDDALTRLRPRVGDSVPLVILLDYDAYLDVPRMAEGLARDELRLQALRALANRHRALLITPHQARKGQPGSDWCGGGFEATKGSGEFVYASDFVLRLKARRGTLETEGEGDAVVGSSLLRGDLLNRHGAGNETLFEARHDQAFIREAPDQAAARQRWESAGVGGGDRRRPQDPTAVESALRKIDAALEDAGGNFRGAVRLLGLSPTEGNRIAIKRAHTLRRIPTRILEYLENLEPSNQQTALI